MSIFKFENLPSTKTPIVDKVLEALQTNILEMMLPVGGIYRNADVNVDPAKELGFGEWELREGVVFVSASRTDEDFALGKTGGEKTHAMTIEDLVPHEHEQYVTSNSGGGAVRSDFTSEDHGFMYPQGCSTGSTGEGKPFNICQPYDVPSYAWVRIA